MKKISLLISFSMLLFTGAALASAHATNSTPASPSMTQRHWHSFQPETLHGTISLIEGRKKKVFITSHNVPYDFKITKSTKIEIAGNRTHFSELANQTQKQASVTFIARPDGNFVKSITVTG